MKPSIWIVLAMCVVGCSTAVSGAGAPDGGGPDGGCVIDGTPCGNGLLCTQESCQAGCFIGGTFFVATEPNPTNSCQVCEPASSTVGWTSVSGPGPVGGCMGGAGQVCNDGVCLAGCSIDGVFVAPGANEPAESCLTCQPSVSTTSWSPVSGVAPDGGSCAAGQVCDNGNCADGCIVDGGFYLTGASGPTNACQTCQPSASTSAFEPASGLAPDGGCAAGQICETGTCTEGCWIGEAFVASGAGLPGASCLQCMPATSTSSYSPVTGTPPDGGSCAADEVCSGGACTYGCIIGGNFLAAGQLDPNQTCRSCEPETSTRVWVNGFTPWTTFVQYADDAVVTDLSGDGGLNVVVASDLVAYTDEGNGMFSDGGAPVNLATATQSPSVAIPYSNPPLPDIFFVGTNPGTSGSVIDYAKNLGDGGLASCNSGVQAIPCVLPTGTDSIDAITAGHFAGTDAGLGLAAVDLADSRIDYFLTMGSPLASVPFIVSPPSATSTLLEASITSGDFNADGLDDLIVSVSWANPYQSDILIFLAMANGTFASQSGVIAGQAGPIFGLAVADLNGDGKLDLAFTDQIQSLWIALGDGTGTFSPAVAKKVGGGANWLTTGDFNGDGWIDVALVAYGPKTIDILFNQGDGTFSNPLVAYTTASDPTSISASGWTPPLAPATYGNPTQLLGATDYNGDVIGLVNSCQ